MVNARGGMCAMCVSRERRKDPAQREKERATSRRWKKKHKGNDWRPNAKKRKANDRKSRYPAVFPSAVAFCAGCGIQMLDPAELCGFCRVELPPYDKVRIMELLPGQDEEWYRYFSLLTNPELEEMIKQAQAEKARRVMIHFRTHVMPRMTDVYRKDGKGNLVGTPDHHRRCPDCGELVVNCKGHADVAA